MVMITIIKQLKRFAENEVTVGSSLFQQNIKQFASSYPSSCLSCL